MKVRKTTSGIESSSYTRLLSDISNVLEKARSQTAKVVNSILTMTYWDVGRRIVEFEQKGKMRGGLWAGAS
jgi:hypothetical protein